MQGGGEVVGGAFRVWRRGSGDGSRERVARIKLDRVGIADRS